MKIVIFCGSKLGNDSVYSEATWELGEELARRWHEIVYGGWDAGLMGVVAKSALSQSATVKGIFPRFLEWREWVYVPWVHMTLIDTMDQRKVMMYNQADAVIALPGWFGTMDEFFEVLTLTQLKQFHKPIGLLNTNNYYKPLFDMMHHMVSEWFSCLDDLELFHMRDNAWDLLEAMGI